MVSSLGQSAVAFQMNEVAHGPHLLDSKAMLRNLQKQLGQHILQTAKQALKIEVGQAAPMHQGWATDLPAERRTALG